MPRSNALLAAVSLVLACATQSLAQPSDSPPTPSPSRAPKTSTPAAPEKKPARVPGDKAPFLNEEAPDFSLKSTAGKQIKLAELRGKVVVIDFWATWCPPCREAMPVMQQLHEKYKDKPVLVLGLNTGDDGADPTEFVQQRSLTYTILPKADGVARKYHVSGIPAFFIIDADGNVVFKEVGFGANLLEVASDVIERALKAAADRPAAPAAKPDAKPEGKKPSSAPAADGSVAPSMLSLTAVRDASGAVTVRASGSNKSAGWTTTLTLVADARPAKLLLKNLPPAEDVSAQKMTSFEVSAVIESDAASGLEAITVMLAGQSKVVTIERK